MEDERAADVDIADVDVKLHVFVVKRFFEFLDMWNVVLLFWLPRIELIIFIEILSGKVDYDQTYYTLLDDLNRGPEPTYVVLCILTRINISIASLWCLTMVIKTTNSTSCCIASVRACAAFTAWTKESEYPLKPLSKSV